MAKKKEKEVVEEAVVEQPEVTEQPQVEETEVVQEVAATEEVVEEAAPIDHLASALAKIASGEPSSNLSLSEQIALKKHEDGIGEA